MLIASFPERTLCFSVLFGTFAVVERATAVVRRGGHGLPLLGDLADVWAAVHGRGVVKVGRAGIGGVVWLEVVLDAGWWWTRVRVVHGRMGWLERRLLDLRYVHHGRVVVRRVGSAVLALHMMSVAAGLVVRGRRGVDLLAGDAGEGVAAVGKGLLVRTSRDYEAAGLAKRDQAIEVKRGGR